MTEGVPYDREKNSMRDFPLCEGCRREYENPRNERRFRAQGISCPRCGPRVWLEDSSGRRIDSEDPVAEAGGRRGHAGDKGGRGLPRSGPGHGRLRDGGAREEGRPQKPFALMALDLETVERYAQVPE